ncbi:MAG: flagellar hook-associated protein FlgL [Deltaproteobacteria bacterium]|nr:flagellar hook-associated protein FlgL [Nannocystaceae bacterium]
MMRVTQNRQNAIALQAVTSARARLQNAQQQAMSGERVTKPSDDPAAAARGRLLGELSARAESHRTTVDYSTARLQTAESALNEAGNVLTRARELATSMANGTMSAAERSSAATEIEQLRQGMIDIANTRHGDEYVFANVASRSPPYADGLGFTYDVDSFADVRRAEVGPSQIAEIGASGSNAFAQRAADPGSVNVIAALAGLVTNLTNNDPDAVRSDIDTVTRAFDQTLGERTRVGVRLNQLNRADQAAEQSASVYSSLRSDLIDADAAEAFSRLTLAENSMQAAVTVAARVLGPSLLDTM